MKQEPISCRADNALAARCQSFAARWACVLMRPIFYLAAYIDNNASFWQVDLLDVALSEYAGKPHNFTNLIFYDVTL